MRSDAQIRASILIAAYKAASFIPAALVSIQDQSIDDWEVIVVEDGPTDGTDSIVSEFARRHPSRRIIYEQLESHLGVAAARNRALDLCRGSAIAFLDADDNWMADHLLSVLNKLEEGHVLACSPIIIWDSDANRQLSVYKPSHAQIRNPSISLFSESFIQTCSSVVVSRETVDRVGRFDEALRIGEDRDYWFRAVESGGSIGCTEKPTCCYVKHSRSSMAKTLLVAEQCVKFYEKHKNAACVPAWKARRSLARALRTHARLNRGENASEARKAFLRAWRLWPFGIDLPLRAMW